MSAHHTYATKNAVFVQSNKLPVGSPPSTSSGKPCSLALPRLDLSKSANGDIMNFVGENTRFDLTREEVHNTDYGYNSHIQLAHELSLLVRYSAMFLS